VGYLHGSGTTDVELALLQQEVERIGPIVRDHAEKIDSLEGSRDKVSGMFIAIMGMQTIAIAILIWALNHIKSVQIGTM
jgi:hypothetical protein